jgi:hypothetical protein
MSRPEDEVLFEFAPDDPPDGVVQQSAVRGAVPPPVHNEIDGLVDAISAGGRPRFSGESEVLAEANDLAPAGFASGHRLWELAPRVVHTAVFRYVACSIVAFAFGSAIAWSVLRSFDAPASVAAPASATVAPQSAPVVDTARSAAPVPLASTAPAPPRSAPAVVEADRPVARALPSPPPVTPREVPPAISRETRVPSPRALAAPSVTPTVTLPPPLDIAPKGGVDVAAVASLAAPSAVAPPPPPAAAAAPIVSPIVLEQNAVLETLRGYTQAYEALDVKATAAVWPSVDRRALARAFSTLKSQQLELDDCKVTIADTNATTRCRGVVEYVRKIGGGEPRTGHQDLVFKMRKLGSDWYIDEVNASELAVARR